VTVTVTVTVTVAGVVVGLRCLAWVICCSLARCLLAWGTFRVSAITLMSVHGWIVVTVTRIL
jgi:hypothetical protein